MRDLKRSPALAAALLLASLTAACGGGASGDATPADTTAAASGDSAAAGAPAAAAPGTPGSYAGVPTGPTVELPANELGRIPVLEYHRLGTPEGEWFRTLDNFRKDLQSLYERGYRPVTMRQVMTGDIDLPRGTSPVVFTFDDASQGQFYLRPDGSIDPNTMVGAWSAFRERNPGWAGGGVWCILPAAAHPSNFFGETKDRETPREQREANIRKKMEWFVENGHEICNHTLYHARLDRGTDREVQDWLGVGEDSLKAYLPADYDVVTMALPLGMWPRNRELAWRGTYRDGKTYAYEVVMEVSGGPNVSPFDREWNAKSVDRFIVAPGALEGLLARWERDPSNRYVSDGDPRTVTFPQSLEARLARERLGGRTPRPLAGAAAAPAAAAPRGAR